jgi:hypothetical protein
MAVMARAAWTDERLDDLNQRVSDLDRRTETGFGEMREEFRGVRGEIVAFQRMTLQLFAGTMTTMILGFAGLILTRV